MPAAIVLHVLVGLLLLVKSPVSKLPEEKEITVDLVREPKPPAKAKAEAPPPAEKPKAEKPQQAVAKIPPPASSDADRQQSPPGVKPAVQFGEKDAGPRKSPNGNSAQAGSASPATRRDPDKRSPAQAPTVTAADGIKPPPQTKAPETPASKPENAAEAQEDSQLQEAKTLFSQSTTADISAITAMWDVPRGERVAQLCFTELGYQLRNASPPYFPDYMPHEPLKEGTVLDVPGKAFRSNSQWYELSYRCEVDTQATKVVNFSFHVGDLIPRNEWKSRDLPSK